MDEVLHAAWRGEALWVFGTALALALPLWWAPAEARRSLRHALVFLAACGALDALAALLAWSAASAPARGLHQAALLGAGLAGARLAGLVLFRCALPWLRLPAPRILEEVLVFAAGLLWCMVRLSQAGVELASLVTTSALITAVVAFAMQDTLGNVLGGLALQFDDSLAIGDWVRVDDITGRVADIQWRFTALRTRNGETVVIPNAQLMKGQFTVLGRPDDGAPAWRRWIHFSVAYDAPPAKVIAAAEHAVVDAEIANLAPAHAASCVALDFAPGALRYALRYWLVDPMHDDATDSAVRVHLLAALQRHGWQIAPPPEQAVRVARDDASEREALWQRELPRRLAALAGIELFAALDDAERHTIAARLVPAPFVRGDLMTRQGATAHWLYIILSGEAEVRWQAPDGTRQVLAQLTAGHFFGEMGLLTGAPRSATVVARSDVECYRLDKAGFEDILHARHAIAESLSRVLAERQQRNAALLSEIHPAAAQQGAHHAALLERIRAFFGLA